MSYSCRARRLRQTVCELGSWWSCFLAAMRAVSRFPGSGGRGPTASAQQAPPEHVRGLVEIRLPFDFGSAELEAITDPGERVARHVRAPIAGTRLARRRHDSRHGDILVLRRRLLERID